jgi:membrane-bound metal-dependent hydrolase YbcI (DUF457 family)
MFAGHVGVAMAIARADSRINLGVLVLASLFLDFVLWAFVLLGWESLTIPSNFNSTHQPHFVFPYSHGLVAGIGWSVLGGAATFLWYPRLGQARARAAAVVAAAVFSHWLLDALVHAPEMPLLGASSAKVGLGLWQVMPVALAVEAVIALAGLCWFLAAGSLSPAKRSWLAAFAVLILAFTVLGMTMAPPPPSAVAMAASSLVTITVVCAVVFWLGRPETGA